MVAEHNQREATARVLEKLHVEGEVAKMKRERHMLRVLMANRAVEYQKEQILERMSRKQAEQLKYDTARQKIHEEGMERLKKLQIKKTTFMKAIQYFKDKGHFPEQEEMEVIGDFVNLDPAYIPEVEEDLNPQALLLQDGEIVSDEVARGETKFYKYKHEFTTGSLNVVLKTQEGDPDLYIGNHTCPNPSLEHHTWSNTVRGDDSITIHYFDPNFIVGFYYIGVLGETDSNYKISVKGKSGQKRKAKQRITHKVVAAVPAPQELEFDTKTSALSPVPETLSVEAKTETLTLKGSAQEASQRGKSPYPQSPKSKSPTSPREQQRSLEQMNTQEVLDWMMTLNISPECMTKVSNEGVTGRQLAAMGLMELMEELGMTKLQAKRILLYKSEELAL
eukprot:CAMPEP_0184328152 /NCGR_PEP_ID=MMETSP1049-20130417/143471_1 /TAXON_ID=77928 /ORGANISM="Proteomonas sulcata, Strain CCMP704" /LENGTH=391 /DNA_ID=CAMNT_0026650447 /DNA_START=87 /DNA_END=1262 /DNA_ORIENTATION=+